MQSILINTALTECERLETTHQYIKTLVVDLRGQWENDATNYDIIRAKFEALDALITRSSVECSDIADILDYCISDIDESATVAAGNDQ